MAPRDEQHRTRQEQAARFRRFAVLLGAEQATSPLQAIADRLDGGPQPASVDDAPASYVRALVAEIDDFLARAKTTLELVKYRLHPAPFGAGEIREMSRLCREEARRAEEAEKRALALRALELAQLAERLERDFGGA